MKNGLYLTEQDSVPFSRWFAEGYKQTYKDDSITELSCKSGFYRRGTTSGN
jgi:hypothetical protein